MEILDGRVSGILFLNMLSPASEIACYPGPYRVVNGFEPDRVANDSCQVEKSKTARWGRSAQSWTSGFASSRS
jgi:hypothetical protein